MLNVCTCLVALLLGGSLGGQPDVEPAELRAEVQSPAKLSYLVQFPKDYGVDDEVLWPVVLFLHGSGERGDDLDLVRAWGPPKLVDEGVDIPAIVVSPQCPAGGWWETGPLLRLLDRVEREHRIDADRVYVTGLSMGGYGTWSLIAAAPTRFAAAVPICGGMSGRITRNGRIDWLAARLREVPVWAFHGTEDRVVPLSETVAAVEAVRTIGGTAKLTVYEGVGHDSWRNAYAEDAMWDWLFEQRRGEP